MENGISLRMVSFCTRIGVRMEQTPTTTIRLKILEPTTLLTASSLLLTSDAVTLTAVSGNDVPIATIVRPMMIGGTFSLFAILELPSTKKSAPFIRNTKPITRKTNTRISGELFTRFSIFLLTFCFYFPQPGDSLSPALLKKILSGILLLHKKDPCMPCCNKI